MLLMSDEPEIEFPSDLLDARTQLHQTHAALKAFPKGRPWAVLGEPDGWDDTATERWRKTEKPACEPWPEEDQAQYAALWHRARELSVFVICHSFWETFSGPDLVGARSKLLHVTLPASETADTHAREPAAV